MKRSLVERNLVVLLFVMVMVIYAFAQKDTRDFSYLYTQIVEKAEQFLAHRLSGN